MTEVPPPGTSGVFVDFSGQMEFVTGWLERLTPGRTKALPRFLHLPIFAQLPMIVFSSTPWGSPFDCFQVNKAGSKPITFVDEQPGPAYATLRLTPKPDGMPALVLILASEATSTDASRFPPLVSPRFFYHQVPAVRVVASRTKPNSPYSERTGDPPMVSVEATTTSGPFARYTLEIVGATLW